MQTITVAIADSNILRRTQLEQSLKNRQGVEVLTNKESSSMGTTRNRRRSARSDLSTVDDLIARTKRLSPQVLLVNLNHCLESDGLMLQKLSEFCPETRIILLTENAQVEETKIISALAYGAKGYLDFTADPLMISKAVRVIQSGGAWIPRKMLGTINDEYIAPKD